MTLTEVRTLANINERAAHLLESGYVIREDAAFDGVFDVVKPDGTRYTVWSDGYTEKCSCPCFEHRGACKHLLAVKAKQEEDEEADRRAAEDAAWSDWTAEVDAAAAEHYYGLW